MPSDTAFRVRIRPNVALLSVLGVCLAVVVFGVVRGGVFGGVLTVCGCVMALLLGFPVLVSTLGRVPALIVDAAGVRLPLMGVALAWSEIATVRRSVRVRGANRTPVLLIVPKDPAVVFDRARPWLRRQARGDLDALGTPLVVDDRSLDHTLAEIADAIGFRMPTP